MTTDLYAELHARPFVSIQTPKLVSVFTLANEHIKELIGDIIPQDFDLNTKQKEYDHRTLDHCGKVILVTEVILQKHTSFICFYFIVDSDKTDSMWNAIPHDIYNNNKNIIENRAIFKTHLRVEKFDPNNRAMNYEIEKTFNRNFKNIDVDEQDKFLKNEYDVFTKLYGSMVGDGKAMVWTPFSSFKDDFNRILVRDISLRPGRLGRLVRRLVEIDLYVTISLKHFDMARTQLVNLNKIEKDVYNILNEKEITNINCYTGIRDKSKNIAENIADNRYNLQAVIAYSGLVWQRIDELREQYLEGWSRISLFLKKNFTPGVETCHSVIKSQMDVSQQIRGVANLLEAGLSLELQKNEAERRKNEESFIEKIQIIALIPVSYYLSHIIDAITCHQLTWLVWLIVPPTSFYLSMRLLFTTKGNNKMECFLKIWKSNDKDKLYKCLLTKAKDRWSLINDKWNNMLK